MNKPNQTLPTLFTPEVQRILRKGNQEKKDYSEEEKKIHPNCTITCYDLHGNPVEQEYVAF